MSKRKLETDVDEGEGESDGPTGEIVDVNFDYYNVNANNDYHAIKRLLMQLFGADAERVETSALTDLVVSVAEESGVGSTIKTEEDEESDPYAVLTVISCRDHPGAKKVIDYVLSKTDGVFHDALAKVAQDEHVGLVVSERLINMPVQVMAPMYAMLADEIDRAGHRFTQYLFVSRAYRLEDAPRDSKRLRGDGLFAFHPEDEQITLHATHTATYPQGEGVGMDIVGRAMLVPGGELAAVVSAIGSTYAT